MTMRAMDFSTNPRKPARESVVPMINVVFLLLIFFLMTAQIAPPDPIDLTPPILTQDTPLPDTAREVWLGPEGLIYDGATDGDALAALAQGQGPVILRADADLPAADFAQVLRDLAQAGVRDVTLAAMLGGGDESQR